MTIDYKKFIDMPSLLLVLGGAIGYSLAKGNPKDFFRNFGDGSVYMGYDSDKEGFFYYSDNSIKYFYRSSNINSKSFLIFFRIIY